MNFSQKFHSFSDVVKKIVKFFKSRHFGQVFSGKGGFE